MERRGRLLSPGVETPECWALGGAVSKAHILGAQDSSADAPARGPALMVEDSSDFHSFCL